MRTSEVIGSTVFSRVLRAAGAFIALSLAAMWAICGVLLWQIDRTEWAAIDALAADARAIAEDAGLEALIARAAHDEETIWHPDVLFERLEEAEPIWALRGKDDQLEAGYEDLWAAETPGILWLEHEEIEAEIRIAEYDLPEGHYLTLARFIPEREEYIWWLLETMSAALLLVSLPLSLTIGFFLSRSVLRRIETISRTVNIVGGEALSARAPILGTADEFDRLSGNINDMLDRLEALNANIQAVTVGAAHDLKTPLANIGGRLELIRADLGNEAATLEHIEAAERYLANLLRVFDGLLRLGEVEAGRRKAAFAAMDLTALVRDMGEAYAPLFEDAQKRFAMEIAPGQQLFGDRELMEQLLSNLLDNALEHSRDAARIWLRLAREGSELTLSVEDDGPGIAPGDQSRIFERFYRADASRSTAGNGLGLSLVKAIAELHGGAAQLDAQGPGTAITIKLAAG